MREVTAETAADYLRRTGRVPAGRAVVARELSGGVSNVVIRVDVEGQAPLVLKQSRVRLRTQAEWLSRLDRIWTERAALDLLATLLPAGTVPAVLFDDRENYLLAMACAPEDAVVWKARLLAGEADPAVARQAGTILGTIHAAAANHPALAGPLAETVVFDQLRIDPYYRRILQVHPDLEPPIRALIAALTTAPRKTFVHADFSPKNILVHARGLTLVDFETAHAGDPAFDLGFFLSHLILKAFRAAPRAEPYLELTRQFWGAYRRRAGEDPERLRRGTAHAAACLLARIDGKSPVDYRDELDPQAVRRLARAALRAAPIDWEAFLQLSVREMHATDPGREQEGAFAYSGSEGGHPVPTLAQLIAREVLDSRGDPTVEVEAVASTGARARAIVPVGASTGRHEARELRDGESRRYAGKGVLRAVGHVATQIAPAVVGMDLDDQEAIDARLIALDGTPKKARLGANAVLGVSLAVAQAAAAARGEELYVHLNRLWRRRLDPGEPAEPVLPLPLVNMISGGLHAGGNLDFQDFLMVPLGAASFRAALEMAVAVYRCVGTVLRQHGEESCLVADEGGYGPRLRTNSHAVERILEAVMSYGLRMGQDVAIALDVAATHFYDPATGTYCFCDAVGEELDSAGLIAMLEHWVRHYPIVSIEDGLAEDDWDGWAVLTARLGGSVQLIGDDLFATQADRLRRGIEARVANAILIKVNQVGTLSETFDTLLLARRHGYRTIISARSGETEDTTIADLAVATGAGQIKIGSVARSERLTKYNRLLRIEEHLGGSAPYAGRAALGL